MEHLAEFTNLYNAINSIKFPKPIEYVKFLLIPKDLIRDFKEGFYNGVYVKEDPWLPDVIYKGYSDGSFEILDIKQLKSISEKKINN